jgi:hypothetical protein
MSELIKPPKVPCGTCPYRRDVPSGIWHASEYEKLRAYDADTWAQPQGLFMCHQQDGCLCGGWLMVHRDDALALRLSRNLDLSVWHYAPDVEVFASGNEAADHGMRDIDAPSPAATRKIDGLVRQRMNDHRLHNDCDGGQCCACDYDRTKDMNDA